MQQQCAVRATIQLQLIVAEATDGLERSANLHASMYLVCVQCAANEASYSFVVSGPEPCTLPSRLDDVSGRDPNCETEHACCRRNLADNDSREFTIVVPVHGLQLERMGGRREGKDGRAGGRGGARGGGHLLSPLKTL